MVDVSIIIVNYNTKELTAQCIESIFSQTKDVSFEVIVVDNDSKDGSVEMLSSDKRIIFVESGGNLGFGRANNLGVTHSIGKYIFFLNSDTLLLNNAVKLFCDFMNENQKNFHIGALGTILMDSNHNRTHSYSNLPTMSEVVKAEWGDHILKRFGKRMARYDENVSDKDEMYFKVGYVTGADLFCSRETIDLAGGFDPDFFMYWEESEMQHRWTKKYNRPSYIFRGPKIVHLEGKSCTKKNLMSVIRKMPSMFLYFKKTSNPLSYYAFRVFMFLGRLHQFLMPSIKKEEKKLLFKVLTQFY